MASVMCRVFQKCSSVKLEASCRICLQEVEGKYWREGHCRTSFNYGDVEGQA
jgi:hypothetical protein